MRFEEIFEHTLITLAGPIDEMSLQVLDRTLRGVYGDPHLENRATILLTTYGGASGYARGLYERLRLAQRVFDLKVVGVGLVQSHGIPVMLAVPREKRFVTAGTRLYLHELQKEMELTLKGPHAARRQVLEQERRLLDEEEATLDWTVKLLTRETGRDEPSLRRLLSHGHHLGAAEAVELGLAGALLEE